MYESYVKYVTGSPALPVSGLPPSSVIDSSLNLHGQNARVVLDHLAFQYRPTHNDILSLAWV